MMQRIAEFPLGLTAAWSLWFDFYEQVVDLRINLTNTNTILFGKKQTRLFIKNLVAHRTLLNFDWVKHELE